MKANAVSSCLTKDGRFMDVDSARRGVIKNGECLRNVVAAKRQQPGVNFMTLAFQFFGGHLKKYEKLRDAFTSPQLDSEIFQVGISTSDWLLYNPRKIFVNHNTVFENGAVCKGEKGSAFEKFATDIGTLIRLIKDTAHLDRPMLRTPESHTMRKALSGDDGIVLTPGEFASDTPQVQNIAGLLQNALQKIRTGSNK